jgi:hypothetical protein
MADPDDEPWLRCDYTHLWLPPEPLPPARWPRVLLVVIGALIAYALVLGTD